MTPPTEEMVTAAMKKAVELQLIPRYCIGEDEYLLDNTALATLGVLKGGRFFG